jgi:hypothetical protein
MAEYNGEILMLLRVAERPLCHDPKIVKAPVYNPQTKNLEIIVKNVSFPEKLFWENG